MVAKGVVHSMGLYGCGGGRAEVVPGSDLAAQCTSDGHGDA